MRHNTGIIETYSNPGLERARAALAAMESASLPPNDGESELDFSLRQVRAHRDAISSIDPDAAAGLNTQLLKLGEMKLQQQLRQRADLLRASAALISGAWRTAAGGPPGNSGP